MPQNRINEVLHEGAIFPIGNKRGRKIMRLEPPGDRERGRPPGIAALIPRFYPFPTP